MQSSYTTLVDELEKEYPISKCFFYILFASGFLCCIGCILTIFSSVFLSQQYSYLSSLQNASIVLACVAIILVVRAVHSLMDRNETQRLRLLYLVLVYLVYGSMLGCVIRSYNESFSASYCDLYVSYSGYVDGTYIAQNLAAKQQCIGYQKANMQQSLTLISKNIVVTYCNQYNQKDGSYQLCLQEGHLILYDTSDMFELQYSAEVLGMVAYLLFIKTTIGIMIKFKRLNTKVAPQQQYQKLQDHSKENQYRQVDEFAQDQSDQKIFQQPQENYSNKVQPQQINAFQQPYNQIQPIPFQGQKQQILLQGQQQQFPNQGQQPIYNQGYQPIPYQGQQPILIQGQQQFPIQGQLPLLIQGQQQIPFSGQLPIQNNPFPPVAQQSGNIQPSSKEFSQDE